MAFIAIKVNEEVHTIYVNPDEFYGDNCVELEIEGSYSSLFYLFEGDDAAGDYCVENQRTLIEDDPEGAIDLIGAETLIQWALGNLAGPGSIKVNSLDEWLELFRDLPLEGPFEEGPHQIVAVSPEIEEHLGFAPTIAYSH